MFDFKIKYSAVEPNNEITEYIKKRYSKLEKYIEDDCDINILLKQSKMLNSVETTIQLPYLVLRSEDRSDNLYTSIDKSVGKIERQLRKYKTKINRKSRQKGYKGILDTTDGESTEKQLDVPKIIRSKKFNLKPMSPEEAALQMELLNHDFFIFKDHKSNTDSIVYKRRDGNYGLIETDTKWY